MARSDKARHAGPPVRRAPRADGRDAARLRTALARHDSDGLFSAEATHIYRTKKG